MIGLVQPAICEMKEHFAVKWLHRSDTPEPPMLDTAYLDRLNQHLGAAVTGELLSDGLIELADRLKRLGELAMEGDLDAIARLGHDIIGTAGHLGLTRLSIAAVDMNRAARAREDHGRWTAPPDPHEVTERVLRLAAPALAALADRVAEMGRAP